MTASEVHALLAARRPNGMDDQIPEVVLALNWMRQQPGGTAWNHRERFLDREIAAGVQEIAIPLDLESQLLALRRKHPAVTSPAAMNPGSSPEPKVSPPSTAQIDQPPAPSNLRHQIKLAAWTLGALLIGALAGWIARN